jgi:hypothetical protein
LNDRGWVAEQAPLAQRVALRVPDRVDAEVDVELGPAKVFR